MGIGLGGEFGDPRAEIRDRADRDAPIFLEGLDPQVEVAFVEEQFRSGAHSEDSRELAGRSGVVDVRAR